MRHDTPKILFACALAVAGIAAAALSPAMADPPPYTEQAFMEAAFDNCVRVDGRHPRSCDCEQKLIKERLGEDDKEMAYYFWVDRTKYTKEYQTRAAADAKWAEGFADRFNIMQALITAACGR